MIRARAGAGGLRAVGLFWATGDGQFDDLDSPGWSVLDDDQPPGPTREDGGPASAGTAEVIAPETNSLSLAAALVAGLARRGHCIGMCGGIAGALAMRSPQVTAGKKLALALAYNLSRITSYAVAGALAGLLGRTLLNAVGRQATFDRVPGARGPHHGWRGRAAAVRLATARPARVRRLRDCGAGSRRGRAAGSQRRARRRRRPRLAWGWLPCAMTYSMLLLAATTRACRWRRRHAGLRPRTLGVHGRGHRGVRAYREAAVVTRDAPQRGGGPAAGLRPVDGRKPRCGPARATPGRPGAARVRKHGEHAGHAH